VYIWVINALLGLKEVCKIEVCKSESDVQTFKKNVDEWIKDFEARIQEYEDLPKIVEENMGNIQHNYELIYEMKRDIEEIKEEIKNLKMVQMLMIKSKIGKIA